MQFTPTSIVTAITAGALTGVAASILLFGAVVLTGSTFGQRCSTAYAKGSTDWNQCVDRLNNGGEVLKIEKSAVPSVRIPRRLV